jgi:hypothetical protein
MEFQMAEKTAQEVNRECQKSLEELKSLLEGKGKPFDPMDFFSKTFGMSSETVAAGKRAAENYRRPT